MSPEHRDPDGRRRVSGSWGGLVERLISEAQERGAFDDLPLHGRPLPPDDAPYAGEWRLAHTILRDNAAAPPWIEADAEVRRLRDERDRLLESARRASRASADSLRRRLDELIAAHDRAVERVNAHAPSARLHRRRIDRGAAHALLDEALDRATERDRPR